MARPPFQNEHDYAAVQEIMRHDDALAFFAEMSALVLLWSIEDFNEGRVAHCPACYLSLGKVADAYKQPGRHLCPTCYGTTFEGGYRALVYRPVMWAPVEQTDDIARHGHVKITSADVQTTSDVQMRDGDYIVRLDGSRWKISQPTGQEITTGFGPSFDQKTRSSFRANMEAPTSAAFLVPVDFLVMKTTGWKPYMIYPTGSDHTPGPIAYLDEAMWDDAQWDMDDWT
jgi:hypothetical protein